VQEAMIGEDRSMTNAGLLIVTLLGFDVLLSIVSVRSRTLEKVVNDLPTLLIDDGVLLRERMTSVRVSEDDIMENARAHFGIENVGQIKYAVLERNGSITVIPRTVGWAFPPTDPEKDIRVRENLK
jgi:uncharacterized membrane protein YcaP (DUF421 family)